MTPELIQFRISQLYCNNLDTLEGVISSLDKDHEMPPDHPYKHWIYERFDMLMNEPYLHSMLADLYHHLAMPSKSKAHIEKAQVMMRKIIKLSHGVVDHVIPLSNERDLICLTVAQRNRF